MQLIRALHLHAGDDTRLTMFAAQLGLAIDTRVSTYAIDHSLITVKSNTTADSAARRYRYCDIINFAT